MKRARQALKKAVAKPAVWKPVLAVILLAGFCSASLATFDGAQANGDVYDAAGMFVQASIVMPHAGLHAARESRAGG